MKQIWIVIQDWADQHPSTWVFDDLPKAVEKFNSLVAEDGGAIASDDEWTVLTSDSWVYLRNPEVE